MVYSKVYKYTMTSMLGVVVCGVVWRATDLKLYTKDDTALQPGAKLLFRI